MILHQRRHGMSRDCCAELLTKRKFYIKILQRTMCLYRPGCFIAYFHSNHHCKLYRVLCIYCSHIILQYSSVAHDPWANDPRYRFIYLFLNCNRYFGQLFRFKVYWCLNNIICHWPFIHQSVIWYRQVPYCPSVKNLPAFSLMCSSVWCPAWTDWMYRADLA